MFKFEISLWTTMFWVRASVFLVDLKWDDCFGNNCNEMSKFEISVWTTMFWVRASVISYKS